MTTQAPFNLQRFLDAQENNYVDAFREIKQGINKTIGYRLSFIIPQLNNP